MVPPRLLSTINESDMTHCSAQPTCQPLAPRAWSKRGLPPAPAPRTHTPAGVRVTPRNVYVEFQWNKRIYEGGT